MDRSVCLCLWTLHRTAAPDKGAVHGGTLSGRISGGVPETTPRCQRKPESGTLAREKVRVASTPTEHIGDVIGVSRKHAAATFKRHEPRVD